MHYKHWLIVLGEETFFLRTDISTAFDTTYVRERFSLGRRKGVSLETELRRLFSHKDFQVYTGDRGNSTLIDTIILKDDK